MNLLKKRNRNALRKLYVIPCISFIYISGLLCQEAIPASGGILHGHDGTISYTVGQTFYSYLQNDNNSVAQGVQHPFEIFKVSKIQSLSYNCFKVLAYPNPTHGNIVLKTDFQSLNDNRYELYDITGIKLKSNTIVNNETNIDLTQYAQSVFILKIISSTEGIQTLSIIKK